MQISVVRQDEAEELLSRKSNVEQKTFIFNGNGFKYSRNFQTTIMTTRLCSDGIELLIQKMILEALKCVVLNINSVFLLFKKREKRRRRTIEICITHSIRITNRITVIECTIQNLKEEVDNLILDSYFDCEPLILIYFHLQPFPKFQP
ncbi:Protein CBG26860 [Caenorhabditis briggsae]|uniref:Protein CBG26860 n=1 Tax=Caenorhabditis briggsae TaxID=6238 RepID=B6II61_CAEBR|nr:Protein CBG26860 [Caenorhabditis briggsae]CAR99591.1 Protein CBG26860 [Caenorhabditis briggsae]